MSTKKTDLIELIMKEAKISPIIGVWNEADGIVGFMVRQDGRYLGIEDFSEKDGELENLDVKVLGKLASEFEYIKNFEFEEGEFNLQINEIKWLYELVENNNLEINGKLYNDVDKDVIGASYQNSGMSITSYKDRVDLKCDIQYLNENGAVEFLKSKTEYPAYINSNGGDVLIYIKKEWSCAVKGEYLNFEREKKDMPSICKMKR